jgi:hypothetical protein
MKAVSSRKSFLYVVEGGSFKLLETVDKDKTLVPPACNFSA